jgi:hypothetical protein
MINALERRERAAHGGDVGIAFFLFNRSDKPFMSMYGIEFQFRT